MICTIRHAAKRICASTFLYWIFTFQMQSWSPSCSKCFKAPWKHFFLLSLKLMYAAARFSRQNFPTPEKFIHQWIACIFLHRLIYFQKEIIKNLGKRYRKNFRWSYHFGQTKMTIFFVEIFFVLSMWYMIFF